MFINGVEEHREVLQALLVDELRNVYNIKYHKESGKTRRNNNGAKTQKQRVFNVPLQNLQLTDAILVNGCVVQVPHFISDSCQKILDGAEVEGIFRKAGSLQRLKEIRAGIENGKPLSRSLNVIDLGDVLKSFFRDLPEPLLSPGTCQEMMLRCLLLPRESERVRALMLTCLLLPPLTLNTLAFFMQFLHQIASHSTVNRMTPENLAIVFNQSLMPLSEPFNGRRLENHKMVIQLLIENSKDIGMVPQPMIDQLATAALKPSQEQKAKTKKRRSSSVTRFCVNGLKKIVNNVRRESVDNNLDGAPSGGKGAALGDINYLSQTPLLTAKKRKHIEIANIADTIGFSAKKKRDILPELLSTPLIFKEKKRRPSLISHFRTKSSAVAASQQTLQDVSTTSSTVSSVDSPPRPPQIPRRWSDATGTPRGKIIAAEQQAQKYMSPVVSLPCLTLKESLNKLNELRIPSMDTTDDGEFSAHEDPGNEVDYVRIPKREYEAIKIRVSAIEKRISKEFDLVQTTKRPEAAETVRPDHEDELVDSPKIETVQDKYERALEETEELNRSNGGTDELAKRLSRDLKIRRSADHKIMRSPSARKIGSIRRRSRDHGSKLNRTKSLHLPETSQNSQAMDEGTGSFYPRQTSNLRRGRPNTVQTGLKVHRSPPTERRSKEKPIEGPPPAAAGLNEFYPGDELWTDAKTFFKMKAPPINIPVSLTPTRMEVNERRISLRSSGRTPVIATHAPPHPVTPTIIAPMNPEDNLLKTPMLPPKRVPRKTPSSSAMKNHYLTPLQQAQQTGRASIARIRSQNAGMVMAKARLFNDLVDLEPPATMATVGGVPNGGTRNSLERMGLDIRRVPQVSQKENRHSPKTYVSSFRKPHIKPVLLANSPRRIVKTPSRDRATPVRALPRSPRRQPAGATRIVPRHF